MVSRILEQQKAIHKVVHDDCKYRHLVPTWQDVDVLESLDAALGTLSDFTDMLSAENFVTLSANLPVIHRILKKEVLSIGDDDTQLDKDMKTWILSYLEQKYTDAKICELLILATFLDPRFITEYVPITVTGYVPTEITKYVPTIITEYVPTMITEYVPTMITEYVPIMITEYVPTMITEYVPIMITEYVPTMVEVSVTKDRLATGETEIWLTEVGEGQDTEKL